MLKSPLTGHLLTVALTTLFLYPAQALAQKPVETVVYGPPSLSLTADSTVVSACPIEGAGPRIRLNARANSPSGSPIRYRWSTASGRITGDGAAVNWDLSGLTPGYYKASVDIETGSTDGECQAFSSITALITPCPPPPPVCPNVSVTCPTRVAVDQPLTFTSNVTGGRPAVAPVYNWAVSAGTIIEGQGTRSIKVDTTGLAGQSVRATLSMGGYTLDCSASCSVQIPVPPPTCRKFDEFPDIARNDEKARLDNYAVELLGDPASTGYVIVYAGRSRKPGDVQKHTTRIVDYLVNSRGIDTRRVVTLTGGAHDELMVDLWICPQGAAPPIP